MISQNNNCPLKMFYGDRLRLPINHNLNQDIQYDRFRIILLKVRQCDYRTKNIIKNLDETRNCYTANQKSLIKRYKKFYKWITENADKDFLCIAQEDYISNYLSSKENELFVQNDLITLTHRYDMVKQIKFFTDFDLIPLPPNYTKKMIMVFIRDYILSKTTFPLYETDYPGRSIF